ncbi:MAG: circadian clock KaiB family protein [Actinomycetota bacterium]|nr:circadian clock KaiB family protein [Actinomycetota bacterium]
MAAYWYRIYVMGDRPGSRRAVANLRALCEASVPGDYELEVVDVLHQPDRAEVAKIMATPTVIKLSPPPRRRVVGDLSDGRLAVNALDLPEPAGGGEEAGRP